MAWMMCKPLSTQELWSIAPDMNTSSMTTHHTKNFIPVQSVSKQHWTETTLLSQKDMALSDVGPQKVKGVVAHMRIIIPVLAA